MMPSWKTDQPEDSCSFVDVDGETVRVRGSGEMDEQDRQALGSVIRAARARIKADQEAEKAAIRLDERAKVAAELHTEGQRLRDCGFDAAGDHYMEAVPAPSFEAALQPATGGLMPDLSEQLAELAASNVRLERLVLRLVDEAEAGRVEQQEEEAPLPTPSLGEVAFLTVVVLAVMCLWLIPPVS